MQLLNIFTYIIWDVNPEIFTFPVINHPVRWYGLTWALGLIIAQQIMAYVYKKEGRTEKEVDTMTLYIVGGTLLGARLGHVLFYDPVFYLQNPLHIFAIWEGGLASHGGGIGILLSSYLFTRKTKVNFLWFLDRLAIAAAITGCLIRIGNLMNSEVAGLPTDVPWAFVFVQIDDLPRHPAQLYEAIYCFILFVVSFIVWYKMRDRIKNGFLTGWFLIILFTLRFIDEFFKMNQEAFEDDMIFNMGQLLSLPYILAGIVILLQARKQNAAAVGSEKLLLDKEETKS
jgi:phosphatidylglycerol---prolipoprotein diacylglyceryl transferase